MPNICSRITDPKKRKLCLARLRSEQSTSPDEAVKKVAKKASKKVPTGRY